jgi:hypothetical protein
MIFHSRKILFKLLVAIFLTGCVSVPEINNSLRKIDSLWMSDYNSNFVEYRLRVIDNVDDRIFDIVSMQIVASGFALQNSSNYQGTIQGFANALQILSEDSWDRIRQIDEPSMKRVGGNFMRIDPSKYNVFVYASIKKVNNQTFIRLDFKIGSPYMESRGIIGSQFPPPTASKEFAYDFWYGLDRILENYKIQSTRRPNPNERVSFESGGQRKISDNAIPQKNGNNTNDLNRPANAESSSISNSNEGQIERPNSSSNLNSSSNSDLSRNKSIIDNNNSIKSNGIIEEKFTIETAKIKCHELGFKIATEGFGKCVLQLSR